MKTQQIKTRHENTKQGFVLPTHMVRQGVNCVEMPVNCGWHDMKTLMPIMREIIIDEKYEQRRFNWNDKFGEFIRGL